MAKRNSDGATSAAPQALSFFSSRDINPFFSITIPAGTSQSDMEASVCPNVADGVTTTISLYGYGSPSYMVPECVANVTSLTTLYLRYFIVPDIGRFPSSITTFTIASSTILMNTTASLNVIDPTTGFFLWQPFFDHFPSMIAVSLNNNNLKGPLSGVAPSSLSGFDITQNAFFGDFPSALLSKVNPASKVFTGSIYSNSFNGTIASDAFDSLKNRLTTLNFDAHSNHFQGTIADSLFAGMNVSVGFNVDFDSNNFTGAIGGAGFANIGMPTTFSFSIQSNSITSLGSPLFPGLTTATSTLGDTFTFNVNENQISTPITASMFEGVNVHTSFQFLAINNHITGSFPDGLFNQWSIANWAILRLDGNQIAGVLPDSLFAGITYHATQKASTLTINLSNNRIAGSIPANLLADAPVNASSTIVSLSLQNNSLYGSLPTTLIPSTASSEWMGLPSIIVDWSENGLTGAIPVNFLNQVHSSTFTLSLASNGLTGTLPYALFSSVNQTNTAAPTSSITFTASFNDLEGSIPEVWTSVSLRGLYLDSNPRLGGEIPTNMFDTGSLTVSVLRFINISSTNIGGIMPTVSNTSVINNFLMSDTPIDFCDSPFSASSTRATWVPVSPVVCFVTNTTACSCPTLYPDACHDSCYVPPISPTASPNEDSTCPSKTRPAGTCFYCSQGVWVCDGTVEENPFIVPEGSTVLITGTLNSSSVIINGASTNITISGCSPNLASVDVKLKASDLSTSKKLTLLTYTGSCSLPNGVNVHSSLSQSSCKKVKVSNIQATPSSLTALFSLSSSGCNTWWIILVSVVGGVIVIGLVIFALLVTFNPTVAAKVRPYSAAHKNHVRSSRADFGA